MQKQQELVEKEPAEESSEDVEIDLWSSITK
jgi:hypothetical protein